MALAPDYSSDRPAGDRALAAMAVPAAGDGVPGQVPTPRALADLMAAWAVRDDATIVLDPACGAGALLLSAAAWRAERGRPPAALVGIEADPGLAVRARLALAATERNTCIVVADFLALPPDPPYTTMAVVANPPFVRHERQTGAGKAQRTIAARGGLNGRADLHAYFWPALAAWLAPGGRAAVVTPASWLEADYGTPVRRYLLEHFALDAIVEPAVERWFPDAAVHAVLVLARRAGPGVATNAPVRLVRLRRRLTDLLAASGPEPWDAMTALVARLDGLAADVESTDWQVRPRSCLATTGADQGRPPSTSAASVRQRVAQPAPLAAMLPWSAWLRAPAVLTALLDRTADRWMRLGRLATVRYPLKSGADQFFYLSEATVAACALEPEYLRPLVRSPRDLAGLTIDSAALRWRVLLLPPVAPAALPPGVRRYVAAGVAAGLDRRPTCAARRAWYALPVLPPAPLLWPRFVHARHAVWLNPEGAIENQTLYGLLPDPTFAPMLAAVLNSSLGALMMEVCGRGSLGDGALQFAVGQTAGVPLPNPAEADAHTRAALTEALDAFAGEPMWAPLAGADVSDARGALDDHVLALLGIEDAGERVGLAAELRAALARLVAERHQRGTDHPAHYRGVATGAMAAAKAGSARSIISSLAVSEMRK